MAVTAVLTGSPSSPSTRSREGRDRDAKRGELHAELGPLREALAVFVGAPGQPSVRARLAEPLRNLAAEATLLDWPLVAAALSRAEAVVTSAGFLGMLEDDEVEALEAAVDQLADALHDDRDREKTPTSGPIRSVEPGASPSRQTDILSVPVFVAGSRAIADTLRARGAAEGDGYAFAVRHLPRMDTAYAAVRASDPRPDVMLIDGDEPGAEQLVEDLLGDSRTDSLPLVVVGSWQAPEHAARFVALGVARCLAKPLAAGDLRRACAQICAGRPSTRYEPLGAMTLDDLGARLASELHLSLCDTAADDRMRRRVVDLGEGSAVLTVMWDAVARIRELVSAQTAGELRFSPTPRDEALPAGLALARSTTREKSDRSMGFNRGADAASLDTITVLVAEEDLTTNWFLSGVLRAAGATIVDAFCSEEALERARETLPDAILAGLTLGAVGGGSLARALRDDVVLRDVPVIVLGADNSQLRRAEELGEAGVSGLLRGASSELVLQRVREVTRARRSLSARLSVGGRVQGRLDELAPTSLLRLVARTTPNARVTLHGGDAVIEVELRDGQPVRACRTAVEGGLRYGIDALSAVLALGAGRFLVEHSEQPVVAELSGSLGEVLALAVARVRRMQEAVSSPALLRIERVTFDPEMLSGLVAMTPEPARTVLAALMLGRAPWSLVEAGQASLELVERVLVDVVRRNGILHFDRAQESLLVRAPRALVDVTPVPEHVMPMGERFAHRVVAPSVAFVRAAMASPAPPAVFEQAAFAAPSALPSLPVPAATERDFEPMTEAFDLPMAAPTSWVSPMVRVTTADVRDSRVDAEAIFEPVEQDENLDVPVRHETRSARPSLRGESSAASEGSSAPVRPAPFDRPARGAHTPILVSRLAVSRDSLRRSTTPIFSSAVRDGQGTQLASLDPVVAHAREVVEPSVAPLPGAAAEPVIALVPLVPVRPEVERRAVPEVLVTPPSVPSAPSVPPFAACIASASEPAVVFLPPSALPSSYVPSRPLDAPPKSTAFRFVAPVVFALVGVSLAVAARWWRYQEHAKHAVTPSDVSVTVPNAVRAELPQAHVQAREPADRLASAPEAPSAAMAPTGLTAPTAALSPTAPVAPLAEGSTPAPDAGNDASAQGSAPRGGEAEEAPVELPLSPKDRRKVDADHGIVEIVAGRKDEIYVDGKRLGTGPTQRIVLAVNAEKHEVRVKMRGEERVRYIMAKAGVKLRFRLAPPWSH